jgi:hypothetical protein
MPTQLQLRRGTTAQTAIFTGAVAEVTVDTDKKTLVVHDGSTQGGFPLPVSVDVTAASSLAQQAFNAANTAFVQGGQVAFAQANAAFEKANGAVQSGFVTISANSTDIVADSNNDTLTINSADGVAIYVNASTDTLTINLAPTGITSGFYGGGANVPIFAVDNFGRITEVSNLAFSAGGTDFAYYIASSVLAGIS